MPKLKSREVVSQYTKSESWKMFNRIAPRYDFLNRFLSLGLDISWRKHIADFLPSPKNLVILDLATGTGDVLLSILKRNQNVKMAYGIDMAKKMLQRGRNKVMRNHLETKIELKEGDANHIPFNDNQFDAVTMAFGIRNVSQPLSVLQEMFRVLKMGGRAVILEFSIPQNTFLKVAYLLYLRHVLPVLGGIVSFDYQAYRYLNKTVEVFPYGQEFCQIMRNVGFQNVSAYPLTFGVATIYQGEKV